MLDQTWVPKVSELIFCGMQPEFIVHSIHNLQKTANVFLQFFRRSMYCQWKKQNPLSIGFEATEDSFSNGIENLFRCDTYY